MVFNSYAFAIFLPVVLVLYYSLRTRPQAWLILLASYVFYGYAGWLEAYNHRPANPGPLYWLWSVKYLSLLWASTVVDYAIGLALDSEKAVAQYALTRKKKVEPPKDPPPPAESKTEESFVHPAPVLPSTDDRQPSTLFTEMSPAEAHRRKLIVTCSIILNLGFLGFFKYCNFFIDAAADVIRSFGMTPSIHTLQIALPIGISFFTFQSMSYTIDVYRGKFRACRDPLLYAVFVAYFPQLVNGPIERADHMIRQYANPRRVDNHMISTGVFFMLIGFFKKVAIADSVAPLVDDAFAHSANASWSQLYAGIWFYAIQIYCDFSGYTDIARGVSRLLGIELMENFRQPYLSTNITEFWRRWHISLSSWLRDYLYIPLGGNRGGELMTYRNLFLTMVLGGFWHGARWTFLAWGGLHGVYLALHKLSLGKRKIEADGPKPITLKNVLFMLGTFHLVLLAWIFFRAPNFHVAAEYILGIVGRRRGLTAGLDLASVAAVAFFVSLILFLDWPQYRTDDQTAVLKWHWIARGLAFIVIGILFAVLGENNDIAFIYFQF